MSRGGGGGIITGILRYIPMRGSQWDGGFYS